VALENNHEAVPDGAKREVVDQQVEPHPRRHAEDGGQARGAAVPRTSFSASTLVRPYSDSGLSGIASVHAASFAPMP
jgi:hypothetical protein